MKGLLIAVFFIATTAQAEVRNVFRLGNGDSNIYASSMNPAGRAKIVDTLGTPGLSSAAKDLSQKVQANQATLQNIVKEVDAEVSKTQYLKKNPDLVSKLKQISKNIELNLTIRMRSEGVDDFTANLICSVGTYSPAALPGMTFNGGSVDGGKIVWGSNVAPERVWNTSVCIQYAALKWKTKILDWIKTKEASLEAEAKALEAEARAAEERRQLEAMLNGLFEPQGLLSPSPLLPAPSRVNESQRENIEELEENASPSGPSAPASATDA